MRKDTQALLLLLTGAALLHACLFTDLSLRYVKEGMRPFLACSGVLLLAMGVLGAARDGFPLLTRNSAPPAHGRLTWLLFLPVLAVLLAPPPALGSYTAGRENGRTNGLAARQGPVSPLPRKDPAPLSLTEFTLRTGQDKGASLRGHTVLMAGFVTPDEHGNWFLTRMIVNCCAADTLTVKVRMRGVAPPPPDTWVAVTGVWRPRPKSPEPTLHVTTVKTIPRPASPYSDPTPVSPG